MSEGKSEYARFWSRLLFRHLKIENSAHKAMMCLLIVYLVCNLAIECQKDECKKCLAYTLRVQGPRILEGPFFTRHHFFTIRPSPKQIGRIP